jgi:hypothetical protein
VTQESFFAVRPISSDLTHPGSVWRGDDSSDFNLSRLEVDYEEREVPDETTPRDHFDREEVSGGDRSPLRPQERLPARRPSLNRIDSVLRQDSLDRVSADGVRCQNSADGKRLRNRGFDRTLIAATPADFGTLKSS